MPTYVYQCSDCNQVVEHVLRIADRENPGPCNCGGSLRQIITPSVVLLDGADPSFPGAAMKWEKDRYRIMEREQKNLRETGDYYPNKRYT